MAYDVRDIDGSVDNAVTGRRAIPGRHQRAFIDLPAALVGDTTEGPSLATLVSQVSFTLPAAAEGQAKVQLRVITADAAATDEWVGIDNISVTGTPGGGGPAEPVASCPAD